MRWSISFLLALPAFAAGPVEFALGEFNAAMAARPFKQRIKYDVSLEPAETFRVEPYAAGGAHISGGDLRGLMYGLLEAADEIRANGRMKPAHEVPSIAVRSVRRFAKDDFADWRPYFETLARDRWNHLTLVYTAPVTDLEKLRTIAQIAADFAVDLTVALWYEPDESVAKTIGLPLIRSIQIRSASHDADRYRAMVFKPIQRAGRRIALDPDAEIVDIARQEGIAVGGSSQPAGVPSWPPNFEIEAPVDFESHAEFYWLWGRLAYDPKTKSEHGESPEALQAAAQIIAGVAESKAPANDWVASVDEMKRAVATAKLKPLDLAATLEASAASLEHAAFPDLQLIATIGRAESARIRTLFPSNEDARAEIDRPIFKHTIVHVSPPDKPIEVTLQIAPIKDARAVRLHYRSLDSAMTTVIEKPAALSVSFTIPPTSADLLYYFEIIDRANHGWFEPDPQIATPFHIIRIQVPQPPAAPENPPK